MALYVRVTQAKNRVRRRQVGTRLATKPHIMLQRDYEAGKYQSKQSVSLIFFAIRIYVQCTT